MAVANGRRQQRTFRLIQVSEIDPKDRDVCDGIPITSVARTLLTLADNHGDELAGALAQAVRRDRFDLGAVERACERSPGRAANALLDAIAAFRIEETWTRSELERVVFRIAAEAGLPRPIVDHWLNPVGEVDFWWPKRRIVLEVDGWGEDGSRDAFENDRARDVDLAMMGIRVIRFTWRQVKYEPERLLRALQALVV